jgi:hypothetical protein
MAVLDAAAFFWRIGEQDSGNCGATGRSAIPFGASDIAHPAQADE